MHQVLSYETPERVGHPRDAREYVAKRTCVSLILTVALFTMASGYLVGKFVSDRQHLVRHLLAADRQSENSVQLSSADYKGLKQLRAYQQAKERLLTSARKLGQELQRQQDLSDETNTGAKLQHKHSHSNNHYMSSSLNTEIFNRYVSCTQDIPPNTSLDSSRFIEELVGNTAERQRECMRIIQMVIDNNLANS